LSKQFVVFYIFIIASNVILPYARKTRVLGYNYI